MNYNPYQYNPYQANMYGNTNFQPYQQNQSQDERIWVQGEVSAKSYLVAPNSFVRLWDSTRPVFYEKRADSTGKPYMETYEYKQKSTELPLQQPSLDIETTIKGLEERLSAIERRYMNDEQSNVDVAEI